MRWTTILLIITLGALQAFILWRLNGALATLVLDKDIDVLALVFIPMAALAYTLRKFANPDREDNDA